MALSILWGRVKSNPSSFMEGCYTEEDEDELMKRVLFLRLIEKCPEKDALVLHLVTHRNKEIKNTAKMIAKEDGLKIPRKRK